MKRITPFISLLTISILFLAACSPIPTSLDGSSWQLLNLNGENKQSDTSISMNFQDGKVSGSDGCNRYNGSYTQDAGKLSIGPDILSTMMACDDAIMQQSSSFYEMLSNTASFNQDGDKLTLSDASGKELATFEKQSMELAGTSWMVNTYNNGNQATTSLIAESEITLNFNQDGTLNGDSGCNSYSGSYSVEGNKLIIKDTLMTLKACLDPEGIMDQESQFLAALNNANTYQIEGNNLEIRTADDAVALNLMRK